MKLFQTNPMLRGREIAPDALPDERRSVAPLYISQILSAGSMTDKDANDRLVTVGEAIPTPELLGLTFWSTPAAEDVQPDSTAPLSWAGYDWEPGVHVVFSPPAGGKTRMLRAMMADLGGTYLPFNEPDAPVGLPFWGGLRQMRNLMGVHPGNAKDSYVPLAVDGVRWAVFRGESRLGSKGISQTLGLDLEIWHHKARASGLILLLSINPQLSDAKAKDDLIAQLNSSLASVTQVSASSGPELLLERTSRAERRSSSSSYLFTGVASLSDAQEPDPDIETPRDQEPSADLEGDGEPDSGSLEKGSFKKGPPKRVRFSRPQLPGRIGIRR